MIIDLTADDDSPALATQAALSSEVIRNTRDDRPETLSISSDEESEGTAYDYVREEDNLDSYVPEVSTSSYTNSELPGGVANKKRKASVLADLDEGNGIDGSELPQSSTTPDSIHEDFTYHLLMEAAQGDSSLTTQDKYHITYTSDVSSLEHWRAQLPVSCPLGFDTEGEGAVIQLSCLGSCQVLIFVMPSETCDLTIRHRCMAVLNDVLGSHQYDKVGIGATHDAIRLVEHFDVAVDHIFDLNYFSRDLQTDGQGHVCRAFKADRSRGIIVIDDGAQPPVTLAAGLKSLFADLFEANFKPLKVLGPQVYIQPRLRGKGIHKWTTHPLRRKEIEYAAKDAIFASLLYNAMITKYSNEELSTLKDQAALEFTTQLTRRKHRLAEKGPFIWGIQPVPPKIPQKQAKKQKKTTQQASRLRSQGTSNPGRLHEHSKPKGKTKTTTKKNVVSTKKTKSAIKKDSSASKRKGPTVKREAATVKSEARFVKREAAPTRRVQVPVKNEVVIKKEPTIKAEPLD